MTDLMPEKLDLATRPVREERIAELRRLFPEVFTEGKVDFDALRRSLGDAVETAPREERFGLRWPGKGALHQVINQPSVGTLVPQLGESVDWDTTHNLIIEGDNLEVLKLLQKSYAGQVKMIYIDPPYNTGNDFVYPDNYKEGLQTYLEFTKQVDGGGRKLQSNTDEMGRYHANWLNMMYPRLYLSRNLLCEDGLVFVSIDDNEFHNLVSVMNEIFGEENYLAAITWEKRLTRSNNARTFSSVKDTIVCYRRSEDLSHLREARTEKSDSIYRNPDNDPRGPWTSILYVNPATREQRPNLVYPIRNPITGETIEHPTHAWKYSKSEHERHVAEQRLWWGSTGGNQYPRLKKFLSEVSEGMVPVDVWYSKDVGSTDSGTKEAKEIIGPNIFDNPKPNNLIQRMITMSTDSEVHDIVLDFFAGSGTTAHAVMRQNAEDGGNRRFILVQLPEPLDEPKTLDDGARLTTIADICRERVRRAGRKIAAEQAQTLNLDGQASLDTGFRAYELAPSNFRPWDGTIPDGSVATQLAMVADHIVPGATDDALLAELLLKLGFELTAPVATLSLAGKTVYDVEGGAVLICLDRRITLDLIEQMAARTPAMIVCLDAGFPDDRTKVNAGQIIASHARDEETSIAFKVV